jgi:hypothetical protein
MEQTRSQRFIQEYARLMKSSAEFFNKDSVLMSREDYDNAKLRILVVFPSPASTKAVSMTAAVLNDYVISSCPGVFIDFAYVPEQDDLKFYDKANMPYALGNVTHLDASHFDIVGFSISILFESISVAWIMNSFTRCDKPLPLTWSERKDKKLSEVPVFYAGGITCSVADILFGELGDGRQAFLDYLHLGEFHCSKLLFDHYLVSREKGRTVQEMIDSFWKEVDFNDWLYQPQAYQVEFNDKNQIVKNVKINSNAPDMCKPYYPDEMPKEMGAARGIVMGNGVNAGLGQILAANGCSRSGFCNFSVAGNTLLGTPDGLFPIESMVDKGSMKLQSTGLVTCKDILRQKDERAYRVFLESGVYLDCSAGHKWIRAIDHKKGNKEKTYTTHQVSNIVNKGGEFVVLRKIGNHFGVEWHSDLKIVNLREDSVLSSDEKCYQYSFGAPYSECKEQVNDLVVRLNFYGFDTGVIKGLDLTTIEWWPMPNCATYDRVVSVEALNEIVPMYDVFDTDDHTVCYNGIVTHQCHEGAYTGGWVENTPERLVELAKLCRKHTASTTLKAYSFNSNYLSDYKRNIYDWLGVYPRVTFNNMRLEELGLDKDALKMMKLAGYQRMTAPLEGISERIRNNLLNKNLSEKALDSYLEYGMMMGAVDCKVGIVLTGYEEEQDWQAFYDFNMKWRKKCHDMGGNIPFRYKCTLAVHYPHTPIEYIERRAAKHAYFGTYIMPNEWNEKYYTDHIRIKLNGFKHSTFIEQAIVDLGRYATPWMYNYIIRPGYPFYNTKTIVTHEEAWEAFKGMVNPDYFFNERKMDEYISICHRIHIAMHANVVFQAKKILKDGANATPTIRCLKTYEGCPVDCKAHVYEKSPLITYGDAWLDESGKLTGKVWEEVKGCQRCKTPADRKKVLARELPMSKNADDILMYKAPSLELRLRFRIQRKKEYEVLSPRNTAFVFFTKFLRKSDELCKIFWELDAYHNMFWQSEEDKTYVVSGQQIVDVTFTDCKAKEIVESLIQEVNAEAYSFRVVSVREVPLTDKIKVDDYNLFYFESTLPAEFWQFAAMNYDGEVKVEGAQGAMETIKDLRLKAPSFTLRDKVKGYFTVPCKYSPWHYLQGLMAVRRISLSKLLSTTSIQCITTVRESNGTCMCGKEKAVSDIGTNMQQKVGRDCLAAFLTSKL